MEHKTDAQEIISLNIDELDVEELERRLELSMALPHVTTECSCGQLTSCGTYCTQPPIKEVS